MSIGDKLTTIAENTPKVYTAGQYSVYQGSVHAPFLVSGEVIRIDDMASVPHKVTITKKSDTVENLDTVKVKKFGKNLLSTNYSGYSLSGAYLNKRIANGEMVMSFTDKDTTVNVSDIYLGFSLDGDTATGFRWVMSAGTIMSDKSNISQIGNRVICPYVIMYPSSKATFNRLLARYDIQVEIGTTATEYEPYQAPVEVSETFDSTPNCVTLMSDTPGVLLDCQYCPDIDTVYEAGKKSEYDAFWDNLQQNGNRTDYSYAFLTEGWNDTNFKPKYPLKTTNPAQMFYYSGMVDTKLECDFSICTVYTYWVFRFCKAKHIGVVDFSNSNRGDYLGGCFAFMTNCTDIDELILSEKYEFNNTFQNSTALKNVKFSGVIGQNKLNLSQATQLTHDSLMSVINCLKDYSKDTSGTSWVVTLGTTNLNKLTNAEKAIATEKGWTLV